MEPYIVFQAERLKSLVLSIAPEEDFRAIMDRFAEISYPALALNPELISFAILELVSNSIRAHKEKGVEDAVTVSIATDDEELRVIVADSGRGFDPGRLPYDLDAPVSHIDIMGDSFQEYREKYGGSRFGMGLYVAKKTFPRFKLCFVDGSGHSCPWFSGTVKGTKIELGVPLPRREAEVEELSEALESLEEV